jgi:rhamnosyl/mannosyltransferase
MGQRAALRFEDLFTAPRTAAAYRRIYQTVIDERKSDIRTVVPTEPPRNGRIATARSSARPHAALEKQ